MGDSNSEGEIMEDGENKAKKTKKRIMQEVKRTRRSK